MKDLIKKAARIFIKPEYRKDKTEELYKRIRSIDKSFENFARSKYRPEIDLAVDLLERSLKKVEKELEYFINLAHGEANELNKRYDKLLDSYEQAMRSLEEIKAGSESGREGRVARFLDKADRAKQRLEEFKRIKLGARERHEGFEGPFR